MAKPNLSMKRIAIDKAHATLLISVSIAVFISIFSLVAAKSLISQGRYQAKVIHKQEQARDQMKKNVTEAKKLNSAYQEFENSPENILGGNPKGNGDKDGENARIVLDALPSKYDFPALATSIEKMLKDNSISMTALTGTDDEVAQASNASSNKPQPVEIPYTVEATVAPQAGKDFIRLFESSIRPMQVKKVVVSGDNNQLKTSLTVKTYFQPELNLSVRKEPVKR